ncbi:hypothetical protein [Xanthobacter aminoxidans]|uniref:hypothetical protein n=1 Tax=Xanthobacter aminoxidans TaxID=186280 RepID=UPI003729F184
MKDLIEAHCVAEARFVAACEIQSANIKQLFETLVMARNALLVRPPMNEEEAVMKRTHIATSDDLADDEFTTPSIGDLIARLCEYRPGA